MKNKHMWVVFLGGALELLLCGECFWEIVQEQVAWKKMIIILVFLYLTVAATLSFIKLVYLIVIGTINNYFNRKFIFESIVAVILTFGSLLIGAWSGDITIIGGVVLISGIAYVNNCKAIIFQKDSLLFYNGGLDIRKIANVVKRKEILFIKLDNGKEEAVSIKICSEEQLRYIDKQGEDNVR